MHLCACMQQLRAQPGEEMEGNWASAIMQGPSKGLNYLHGMRPGSDGPSRQPSVPLLNRGALTSRGMITLPCCCGRVHPYVCFLASQIMLRHSHK